MEDPARILLVAGRFLPFYHAGDKNFWLDLVRGLLDRGRQIKVLSVTIDANIGDGGLPIEYVRPVPAYLAVDKRFNDESHVQRGTTNYLSKTISLPRIILHIRNCLREFRPDVVHFADNYGPAMVSLRATCPGVKFTISAPTYQANRRLYDLGLRMSLTSFEAIAPFSQAYANRLIQLGVAPERVHVIRWGVDTNRFRPALPEHRATARARLGCTDEQLVVLWTGYTQQTGRGDLEFAIEAAKAALRSNPEGLVFAICFKEEHYQESYTELVQPGVQVFGTADDFDMVRTSADVLLAPIVNRQSTAAPPLVWLESLAMGLPIVTTPVPGSDEAIIPYESGFTVETPGDAARRILQLASDPNLRKRLGTGARQVAVERYSITRAIDEYDKMWAEIALKSLDSQASDGR